MNILKEKLKEAYYSFLKKKFKNENFTIISNNCFGGVIYKNFKIEYKSPTCGLFFMPGDYIKFVYNLKKYLCEDIKEISINESNYSDYLRKIKYTAPIGKIDDIEIFFLHYDSFEEAVEKWNRRKSRIVWKNIIYKFNDQNQCGYSELEAFDKFKADKKICFTAKKYSNINTIQLKQFEEYENVLSDTKYNDYKNYIDIFELINR